MIEVMRSGMYDSIQDLGRLNYRAYGVPYSGAMDQASMSLANALLHNDLGEAVIEMTYAGPKLKFHKATIICVTGAQADMLLNERHAPTNRPIEVESGAVLDIRRFQKGARTYLAIEGGIDAPVIMDSRSQYQHITERSQLRKGDVILFKDEQPARAWLSEAGSKIKPTDFSDECLKVFRGPEYELFPSKVTDQLFSQQFQVNSASNRMAYQFEEVLPVHSKSILTSMVLPGTVQFLPSGQLVVLMRDAQTTGGYPRVLQLSESAVNLLSQKAPGRTVRFQLSEL